MITWYQHLWDNQKEGINRLNSNNFCVSNTHLVLWRILGRRKLIVFMLIRNVDIFLWLHVLTQQLFTFSSIVVCLIFSVVGPKGNLFIFVQQQKQLLSCLICDDTENWDKMNFWFCNKIDWMREREREWIWIKIEEGGKQTMT